MAEYSSNLGPGYAVHREEDNLCESVMLKYEKLF